MVTSITIHHYSLSCTQWSGYEYYYLTLFIDLHSVKWLRVLLFHTIYWFAHSEVITSITSQHYSLICKQWSDYGYFYPTLFIDLQTKKWLRVLLFKSIHWFVHSEVVTSITIQHYSLICTQWSGYEYYYLTLFIDLHKVKLLRLLLFNTIHWFAHSEVVTTIAIHHYSLSSTQWSGYEYYYLTLFIDLQIVKWLRVLLFNTLYWFAHSEVVASITSQHYSLSCTHWSGYEYYYLTLFIHLHTVKWLRVLLFKSIH